MFTDLQNRVQYGLLILFSGLVNILPYRVLLALAWGVAAFLFFVVRMRRREVTRRIRSVFGKEISEREVQRIAWISLRNFAFNVVEMMRASHITKEWVNAHVIGFEEQIPRAKELVAQHGGLIFAVPHMGNWDMAGWACSYNGVNIFSIAARQRNPYINAWIMRQREKGIKMLERGGSVLKQVIKNLKSGQVFAILPDVRIRREDLEVPFLGGVANLGRGMATFAIAANVPIVPAVFMRKGWTQHEFVHFEPLYPDPTLDKDTDIRRLTEAVIKTIDAAIRKNPEQWFWYNGRWILDPVRKSSKGEKKS
jgi:Kdo2-lipid IVA lauroyltransferase/acyltransferase